MRFTSSSTPENVHWSHRGALLLLFWVVSLDNLVCPGKTPDDPDVRELIVKAKQYLATAPEDTRLGADCLVGMVFVKEGEADHPKVKLAVKACETYSRKSLEELRQENEIYSLGLAIVFLTELDPGAHRQTIDRLLKGLWLLQKEGGGWGYASGTYMGTGDTSMSQYAALAAWSASSAGIPIARERIPRFAAWLVRTQDPSGAWGYQGDDPEPEKFQRRPQREISLSLATAGLGSLYICADLMRLGKGVKPTDTEPLDLPKVLTEVDSGSEAGRPSGVGPLLTQAMFGALRDGDRYLQDNFAIDLPNYKFYYLYALERYQSFRERVTGKPGEPRDWYERGVAYLRKTQKVDGAWREEGLCGVEVDTAFASLFLLRSTKKALEKSLLGPGAMVGGRGLPRDLSTVELRGGKIVNPQLAVSADDVLAELEDSDEQLRGLLERVERIDFSSNPNRRQDQLEQWRRIVLYGTGPRRQLAVRALAQVRDLENAPYLILALEDPNPEVVLEARNGLLFLSRRLMDEHLPDTFTADQVPRAIAAWKEWYRSVRPDAEFLR